MSLVITIFSSAILKQKLCIAVFNRDAYIKIWVSSLFAFHKKFVYLSVFPSERLGAKLKVNYKVDVCMSVYMSSKIS